MAMQALIYEIAEQTEAYDSILAVAEQLDQARYISRQFSSDISVLVGAFVHDRCVGFLRFLIHIVGSDQQRQPILDATGQPLREGYVEAFGILPAYRRHGIGQALQTYALAYCRDHRCYQIRSRSPVSSVENYALKLKMGFAIHPSNENDSYYFIKTLKS